MESNRAILYMLIRKYFSREVTFEHNGNTCPSHQMIWEEGCLFQVVKTANTKVLNGRSLACLRNRRQASIAREE